MSGYDPQSMTLLKHRHEQAILHAALMSYSSELPHTLDHPGIPVKELHCKALLPLS